MYLRAAKTEAEEAGESTDGMANSVSELRNEILNLTGQKVDIQLDENTFKSTYQILQELSYVWDSLTDVSQANLLELLGGKRNANVVSALLDNFSVAEKALIASTNAAGSAIEEHDKYLDSIAGKTAEFTAQFQALSASLIDGNIIKTVVELGTGLLSILTGIVDIVNAIGGLNTVLAVTAGVIALIKADSIMNMLTKAGQLITSFASKIITLTTNMKDFVLAMQLAGNKYSGLEQISKALGAVGISASTAQVAMLGFLAAVAGIYIAAKAVDYFTLTVDEAKENIEDLSAEMRNITNHTNSIASEFRSLNQSAESVIPRFTELAKGVNEFGENVNLTDEEYTEFLGLNNKIAEMFPELNAGMDSNGNAMLSLSLTADTLSDSLWELVEAEREAANVEIAKKLPDALDNLKESEKNFDRLIEDVEDQKRKLEEAYSILFNPSAYTQTVSEDDLLYWEYDKILSSLGVNVSHILSSQSGQNATYTTELNFDTSEVEKNYENALAGLEKQIHNLEKQAAAKWGQVNPIVSAWLQTDYQYNDLNDGMQSIVQTMVSGLDFSTLGLTTEEQVQNYIYDNILTPLYTAEKPVKEAFENISNWQEMLSSGKMTSDQFATNITNAFNELLSGMDPSKVDSFKNIFVDSFGEIGVAGSTFDEVVNGFISTLLNIPDASGAVTDNLDTLKTKLLELTAAYSKWQQAQSGPESGDIYDDSIKALEQIQDGLESGKVGTDKYKASVEFLVPEANRQDVAEYVESLKRYISEDADGVSNFISDAITAGLMVDDGSGNISIVSDATVQDFCDKLTITSDMAQAIFGELEEYGWEFNWSLEDFVSPEETAQTKGELQAVQDNLDGIAESADTVSAKTIGDLGASQTVVSLIEVINWMDEIDNKQLSDKHVNVYMNEVSATGPSNAHGTDHAEGGRTLVGEHGAELVVSDDRYYLVGEHGAEFVNLKHGDMVFNHVDTQKILNGRPGVRGQALRYGAVGLGVIGDGIIPEINVKVDVDVDGAGRNPSPSSSGGGDSGKTGGSGGSGSRKSGGSGSSTKKKSSWFEKQLKEHKHLVEMEKESQEDYLNWLDDAYKKAYAEGIIELDDFYKYEEEVYKGRRDLFKDHLNDIDHEISMLEAGVGNSDEIIELSLKAIQGIEKELAAAREAGLDENGDYIQWLEQQWINYHDSITDIREDAEVESRNTINDLVEYRIKMLKQEIEDEKEALNKKLDALHDFYDEQRKMLQDQYDEEKYLEERQEKRKSVSDLRAELAMLERDNSAWAQKRKLELEAELSDAEKDLSDFEKDYALDKTLDMLDEQQAAQEEQIQAQMDALDAKLNDPHALFNQALDDIKNNTAELYKQFIEYNRKHGSGNDQDIAEMWEEAYKADLEYQGTHNGEHLDGIAIGNYTGYTVPVTQAPSATPVQQPSVNPSTEKEEAKQPSLEKGSTIQVKKSATHYGSKSGGVRMASFVPGGKYTVYKTSGNEVLIGKNGSYTGWIKKSDIVGYGSGTSYSIGGLAQWDEEGKGSEYIFESSDGNRYRMFAEGSKVLNADATDFLYKFATTGGSILAKMLDGILNLTGFNNVSRPIQAVEIHTGDIVVQGNANERTISEIRRAQRDSINYVIKEFNKLNK